MKNYLTWEQTLFKDREIFDSGYVPETFLYREAQMKSIGYSIAPGIEGKQPQNIICLGPPGTGKTTSFKKIIDQAEQISPSNLILAYVNCRYTQTHYSVLAEIYKKITGIEPPTSGIALKKLYEKIAKTLMTRNKSMFVILDDADFLVSRKIFLDIVNNFLRLHEEYPISVGLSSVHSTQCPLLDNGLTSVFIPTIIKFPSYSWDETFDILNTRVKIGLYSNVVKNEIIEKITDYAVSKGDIRFGIDLLKRSVIIAEKRASTIAEFIDVDTALIEASNERMKRYLKVITDSETALLNLASDLGTSQAGDLFCAFSKRTRKGYTTFHKSLNKLVNAKLVYSHIENRGKNGRTRVIIAK
ncbi:MAG: AAA family ATPase (plasmid) [Candidatus Methanoperedens sp.]|uniref:AAA family ATPase n=1 Tax=Candidatus Methanoperedens sp. BLZ2 TaxID=2035255 RepID=UPI000BE252A8|nr:AAA family ATPase [Candidatus Methanoperedens sp. BLZ2]KAB2946450.1 MAG: AAA family ATPase [Candidatus Methanoperedens sp.]MBZ0175687.1 AAA family ATPase [Candidatus Methanoperedens nitroreducens]WAH95043.1 MAG: AAA family ATPase [Candidatus Methanoperedens sp.]WAM22235.1 MAG: AAA family ATPase [Candidatus Methanoperedens sp.]